MRGREGDLRVEVEHEQGGFNLAAAFEAPGGVTALFGRSGSGKTTLVNIIAGLLRPRRGRVVLGGQALVDTASGVHVPAHRRRIGYVFQDGRLFPHLSVRQNLLFGRWFAAGAEDRTSLASVVELLGIAPLLGRRPGALSGGEKQRVAIGRALLAKPRLLLMDEPLAALDDARKAEILPFIEQLRDEAGVPIVYVTHAITEVARLADTLVVLENGRVAASGSARDTLARTDIGPLAGIREAGAVLDAEIEAHDRAFGLTTLSTPAGDLRVPLLNLPAGARLRLQIPARDVILSLRRPDGLSALNILPGTIDEVPDPSGADGSADIRLDCGGARILARITRRSVADLALARGMPVFAIVKSVALAPDRSWPERTREDG
ncbi:molybdenum ABC transporter ATP-binding protein [uncultured Enterovirga sp.]|uniref:molybdenum ABC transporter ATP-binding protein n=1 Tax=uncultured Enterovirga sp. TaxID=2026352 RepID=UPI0035CB5CF9